MHFLCAEMTTPALGGLETSKRPTISIAPPSTRQRAHFLILFKRENYVSAHIDWSNQSMEIERGGSRAKPYIGLFEANVLRDKILLI